MTVRPILFSGPMVRAILREVEALGAGKTQTRRIIPQPEMTAYGWNVPWQVGGGCVFSAEIGDAALATELLNGVRWQASDVLWCREAIERANGEAVGYPADGAWLPNTPWIWRRSKLPAIHMPRTISRLTLTVEEVRVERLQDIDRDGAKAEGVYRVEIGDGYAPMFAPDAITWQEAVENAKWRSNDPVEAFERLWTGINGPGSWAANPFVAAIRFTPHLINVDAYLADLALAPPTDRRAG